MKKLILAAMVAVCMTGCASQKIQRTGSICLEPFKTAGFKTSNPIDVKQDTVDAIRDQMPPWFKQRIEEESPMKFVEDCSQADYKITGRITTVNTSMQGATYVNPFFGNRTNVSHRSFGVGVVCTTYDIKTASIISVYEDYEHGKNLDESLENLAHEFLHTIDYVKTK